MTDQLKQAMQAAGLKESKRDKRARRKARKAISKAQKARLEAIAFRQSAFSRVEIRVPKAGKLDGHGAPVARPFHEKPDWA